MLATAEANRITQEQEVCNFPSLMAGQTYLGVDATLHSLGAELACMRMQWL